MINYLIFSFILICSFTNNDRQVQSRKNKLKYLALGDSYTIGESVTESERFPVLLADKVRSNGIPLEDPVIIAKTGWTTDGLLDGIEEAQLVPPYDLVTLLIGVNNQYRGRDIDGNKIISDFRSPDNIRLGFAPLYNSFEDVYLTVRKLKRIVVDQLFLNYDLARDNVT